jgi:hypothetical protein
MSLAETDCMESDKNSTYGSLLAFFSVFLPIVFFSLLVEVLLRQPHCGDG